MAWPIMASDCVRVEHRRWIQASSGGRRISAAKTRDFPGAWLALVFVPYQREEFVAGLFVIAEFSEHRAGHRLTVLFFHSAHLHAQVAGLDDHAETLRGDLLLTGF